MATIDTRSAWGAPARRPEADAAFAGDMRMGLPALREAEDPGFEEPRWPAWKVTIAVVLFCGSFWMGVGYLAMRLLG